MSTQITTAFVEQYKANVELLGQQKGSKLRGLVRVESVTGENAAFDQISKTSAYKITTRHGDTKYVDTPHARRWVTMQPYAWADLIDRADQVALLADPTSAYAQNAAYAMGRAMDEAIIAAAFASSMTGKTSASGTTAFTRLIYSNASATGNTIVHDATDKTGAVGGTSAGLTLNKLLLAKRWFDDNDIGEEDRIIICNPKGITDLLVEGSVLGMNAVTSADYNAMKALVKGDVQSFCGFTFVSTTLIERGSSNDIDGNTSVFQCIATTKSGLLLALGNDIQANIERLPTKHYSTQVYYSMMIGATRMDEDKVLQIECI
jgi:hypothetical protein